MVSENIIKVTIKNLCIEVNMQMILNMEKEYIIFLMVIIMKDSFFKIKFMALDIISSTNIATIWDHG